MDGAGLGSSVEAEVWDLFDADTTVTDETAYLVAAALHGDAELAGQLGDDAPAPQRPNSETPDGPAPLHAFIRSITVQGFRGIGPRAVLELNPFCGITVVSGRNGSGKSSFAEALEYALTGASYRWLKKKGQHWEASWRNLHAGDPASIEVDFAMEPDFDRGGTNAALGVTWAPGADVSSAERWSQITGQRRGPADALGWKQALITHRPLISYDELGGLLEEGPSALYDALNRLLGLDEIADADNRLKEAERHLSGPRKASNDTRIQLRRTLDGIADARAAQVKKLTAKAPYDLAAITTTTLGTNTAQAGVVTRLRAIATLEVGDPAQAAALAEDLRTAIDAHADIAGSAEDAIAAQAALLRDALELHTHFGDGPCPVCQSTTLDTAWRGAAQTRLEQAEAQAARHHAITLQLKQTRAAAERFARALPTVAPIDGVSLKTLPAFEAARTQAVAIPASLADLPAHLQATATSIAAAADTLRAEATQRADELEDAWAPTAAAISAWVEAETIARTNDDRLRKVQKALKWLRTNAITLRERRMAPMVDQARAIWSCMRHESNVDLGGITLEGAATRRRAVVEGTVDGVPAGALGVMSQGELHALALALFIPRATTPASPFRFLVLDDPIQAMDPAKIGGFLDVLIELAKTRQVVVFSHDDRLPAAIRARSVPAQLLDVTREEGSIVVVKPNDLPADRYIADAKAVILDENLDDLVKRKATPGLFRMAVESAAHQRFFNDRARAGTSYYDSDAQWEDAKTTQQRVALAVIGAATGDLTAWKSRRQHRFPIMAICASGVHRGATLDRTTLGDLAKTVHDIMEDR